MIVVQNHMPSSLIEDPPIIWLHPENNSLQQPTVGLSIHMGDATQVRAEGKGSIKLKHGMFKDVLYVPSLAVNLLYVYQMTLTGPPKRVVLVLTQWRSHISQPGVL